MRPAFCFPHACRFAPAPLLRAQKTANRVLSMRNFSAAWLRAVQDGVIEGSKDGTKKVVSGGIVIGTSALGAKLFGAWIGLATFVSSFAPFAKKAEEVQPKDDDLTDV
jgi:hypothetical protein